MPVFTDKRDTDANFEHLARPFGGFGYSGLGSKAGGKDSLLQFLLPQTVPQNTTRHGFVT